MHNLGHTNSATIKGNGVVGNKQQSAYKRKGEEEEGGKTTSAKREMREGEPCCERSGVIVVGLGSHPPCSIRCSCTESPALALRAWRQEPSTKSLAQSGAGAICPLLKAWHQEPSTKSLALEAQH
jgi:hypothetical protein